MSWTQGIQVRENLPESFVIWADNQSSGILECVVWDAYKPGVFHIDYYDETRSTFIESKTFKLKV